VEGEERERLEYRMLEGSCDSGEVLLYLLISAQTSKPQNLAALCNRG
jgi:hypothetical protein